MNCNLSEMPGEECGICGVFGHTEASKLCHLGLYALQHRGQESAGIASFDGERLAVHRGMGLVADVFQREYLDALTGEIAIGHVRYSTTGASLPTNCQPLVAFTRQGKLALAHNGNLINSVELRSELEQQGAIFQTGMDSEIIIHLIARSQAPTFTDALVESLNRIEGAYSIVIGRQDGIMAVRDPHGFRPLCIGQADGAYLIASESCAFSVVDGAYIRDVEPGEMVIIDKDGIHSFFSLPEQKPAFCIFEYIYYSRPDSIIDGSCVYEKRLELGKQLAREQPAVADVVIAVPDSSNVAALGYSMGSGIPLALGLIRNHYVGRTFIEPDQRIRNFGARLKYTPVAGTLKGKRVVVVDDSIVRGTTSGKIVAMVREAGALEIHFRASSPPWKNPCYYGIDTPTRAELIGGNLNVEEIRRHIGADTLGYLSIEGLKKVFGNKDKYCMACFDNVYPAGKPGKSYTKEALEHRAHHLVGEKKDSKRWFIKKTI